MTTYLLLESQGFDVTYTGVEPGPVTGQVWEARTQGGIAPSATQANGRAYWNYRPYPSGKRAEAWLINVGLEPDAPVRVTQQVYLTSTSTPPGNYGAILKVATDGRALVVRHQITAQGPQLALFIGDPAHEAALTSEPFMTVSEVAAGVPGVTSPYLPPFLDAQFDPSDGTVTVKLNNVTVFNRVAIPDTFASFLADPGTGQTGFVAFGDRDLFLEHFTVWGAATEAVEPLPGRVTYSTVDDFKKTVPEAEAVSTVRVENALIEASGLVDRFCGTVFGDHPGETVYAHVREDGIAHLTAPMRDITRVAWRGATEPLAASAWAYLPPAPGEAPAVRVGRWGGWDDLVVGAERHVGGWGNLYGAGNNGAGRSVIEITGTIGTGLVPASVETATVMLAAWLLGLPVPGTDGPAAGVDDLAGVASIQREGYGVTFAVPRPGAPVGVGLSTTGLPEADRLLAAHINRATGRLFAG